MSNQHFLRRGRRFGLNEFAGQGIDLRVTDWVNRLTAFGASTPSNNTLIALSSFYTGMDAAGLWPKMYAVNCFVPDSFNAATIPQYMMLGSPQWATTTFVSGDLSVNGFLGNTTTKFFDTGIVANTVGSDTDIGFTLYMPIVGTANNYDMGYTNNAGSDTLALTGRASTNKALWYAFDNANGLTQASNTASGYFSGNRTASNASAIYFANSTIAHTTLASTSTTAGSRSANRIYVGAANAYQLGSAFGFTGSSYSFCAVHHGLTAAQSSAFFTLVQSLRVALGGGFV